MSRVFTPLTPAADTPWFCTATGPLPWPKQVRRRSQRSEFQQGGQSLAGRYSHKEGMTTTCQQEIYHQVPSLQSALPAGLALADICPRPCFYGLIQLTSVHPEQTVIAGNTSYVGKSYLSAIQRVFMYKCLHKLLGSNVT